MSSDHLGAEVIRPRIGMGRGSSVDVGRGGVCGGRDDAPCRQSAVGLTASSNALRVSSTSSSVWAAYTYQCPPEMARTPRSMSARRALRRGAHRRRPCPRRSTPGVEAQVHVERPGHALDDAGDAALLEDRREARPSAARRHARCSRRRRPPARIESVAAAAAVDSALPLYVPGWTTGPPPISCIRSRRPATAEIGKPLAIALAKVARSGVTPNSCWPPPGPTRKPDTISSKIRTTPWRLRDLAQALEVARRGRDVAAPERFDDDRGDVAPREPGLDRLEVVPGQDHGVLDRRGVLAGREVAQPLVAAGRDVRRGPAGRRRRVDPAVVVALELDDDVAAGRAAGDAERQLDRLAAGVREPHHLGAGHELGHEPRGLVLVHASRRRAARPAGAGASRPRPPAGGLWPRMIGPAPQ